MTDEEKIHRARLLTAVADALAAYTVPFARENVVPDPLRCAGPLGYIYVEFVKGSAPRP